MRYGVLGPVEAYADNEVLAIGGPQQRRMLALLLQRPGQAVSTDRMVDCLWNDRETPDGAARSVMTYVSRLRSALGDEAIERVHDGYRLVLNGSTLDVGEFEACLAKAESAEPGRAMELYDQALALWRGDAYGELGQEWWLLAEAERLNEMRLVGMEERVEVMVTLGQHQRAIPELNWMRSSHPLRERPVALLMRALLAAGRQADALREYHTYRAALGEETGLEPSAELQTLERSVAMGQAPAPQGARMRSLRGYTVLAVIGEGAYGRVLAATQPGTNRDVAIKVIRPELADDSRFVQRFEAEAQLVARLEHPHIVPLYDYWREPGGAYLVFRLLTGGTAEAALVSGGAFDVARVSRIVEEVGSALLSAHTAGVVHCDVKPSNVLFDNLGNSYLTDFGIALTSSIDEDDGHSRAYDVPELAGRRGDTVQSDIFSFGCMLWELLADESPRAITNLQWQAPRTARAEVRRLPSLAGRIGVPSAAIDAVIARATEPDPNMRFESMAEVIVAWRVAVGRDEGVLTPIDQPRGPFTSSNRRRAALVLSGEMAAAVNPYKGLRPFDEADADDFFGRDDVAGAIREAVAVRRLVTIVGPSGSGKSSVVSAGLVPMLRKEGARIASMMPGEHPCESLRQALRGIATGKTDSADELALIDAAVSERGGDLVLVIDQFEECWTLSPTTEREHFLSALAHAASRNIRCVATVRADLYDRPLRDQVIGQLVADGTFALPPLTPEAMEEAVVRPARRHGVEFDDGVATAIVAEAAAHPAGLPLLQFALAELYERRSDGRITAQALHDMGGVGGAVGRRAEETYQASTSELQAHARELFARLVAPGMGGPDTRRRARLGELSQPAGEVADRFVQARLLVADRDHATREPVVEVAHEALLTNWPRLREWLNDDREWIARLQHLATAARTWSAAEDVDAELYRGSRLEAVLEALPERAQELNRDEMAFVDASRLARDAERERERRTNRRLRRLLTVAVCLIVVSVVAGLLAYNRQVAANHSRRGAEITTLTTRSEAMRSSNRDAAALLAIEANRLRPDNQSRAALFSTFTEDPGFLGYHVVGGADAARVQGALIPDSDTAIVSIGYFSPETADSTLRTIDLTTGEMGAPVEAVDSHDYMMFVAVSADGRVAVAHGGQLFNGSNPSEARGFDVATGRAIGPRVILSDNKDQQNENFNVGVNGDGTQIAVGGGTAGETRVFDLRTAALITTIEPPPDMQPSNRGTNTASASWAPDGTLYVGSSGTHLRQFDPHTFELIRDITVPGIAGGGSLQFSPDGGFVIARGVVSANGSDSGSVARVDLADGHVAWTIPPEQFAASSCDVFTFSVPEDRLYCADYSGLIRGRSLSTGALDGTIIDVQRSGLTGMAVQSVAGHRFLVTFGGYSPQVGRWQIDGGGPLNRHLADGWAGRTHSGDVAELDWSPSDTAWRTVSVGSDECPGAERCPMGRECWAELARDRAQVADVVVVNTHLYGIDVGASGAIIPEHDIVVFDEAHGLEDIMSDTVGVELAPGRFVSLASSVRGILADQDLSGSIADLASAAREALSTHAGQRLRFPLPDAVTDFLGEARLVLVRTGEALQKIETKVEDAQQRRLRAMQMLARTLEYVETALAEREGTVAFVSGSVDNPRLEIAPLDVGPALRSGVWERRTAILTSATVPATLAGRVGLPTDATDQVDVGSPFDYPTQALLYCAMHLPAPKSPRYRDAVADELLHLIEAAGGRTLALFTSWAALDHATAAVRDRLSVPVLTQRDLPKPALVAAFTESEETCLFATTGLFQGVDIPGATLSLVVIDKLPFPRPDDPLLSARRELLGAAAFDAIDVPRAATMLAQASGRLIRTADDRGVVAVLDPRLGTARYRWDIVKALPPMRRTRDRAEVEAFLRDLRA